MKFKSFKMETKVNLQKREYEGYASVFGVRDLGNDIVQKGAFAKTLKERLPKNQIKVLYQHDLPIGLPLHMEEDSTGLFVHAKVSKTALGDDVLELIRDGVVDGLSIGYETVKEFWDKKLNANLLQEVILYEFSNVHFPMLPEATVNTVKRIHDIAEMVKLDVKEGRILSGGNRQKVQQAIDLLQSIIRDMENEPKQIPVDFSHVLHDIGSFSKKTS